MGSGYSKFKKQAKMLQNQYQEMQENLKKQVVEGVSGNGLIKLKLNGAKELIDIKIDKQCVEDIEGLQDLIIAAHDNAVQKLEDTSDFSNTPFHF